MVDVANYLNFFHTACHGAAAAWMAWGETASLDSAQHDVVEGASRRVRTKSGRAS